MFISCPHCRELVAIDRETRLAPEMCPRCGGVLRESAAAETSAADVPATGERSFISFLQGGEAATATAAETASATVAETIDDATTADPPSVEDANEESAEIETGTETMPAAFASTSITQVLPATPSFTRQIARPGTPAPTAKWQWTMLIVLSLALALQVLLADRARLAADATWRPLISHLCGALGCSVPSWHQPGAFAMLSRDVSPIAGSVGGLNVQATFRNDARWAQDWPVLLLSLSDADGRVLGSRAFTPREYLGAAATQTELAPGQSAQIALQLHEPDPDVVAFTFDFR